MIDLYLSVEKVIPDPLHGRQSTQSHPAAGHLIHCLLSVTPEKAPARPVIKKNPPQPLSASGHRRSQTP